MGIDGDSIGALFPFYVYYFSVIVKLHVTIVYTNIC